MYQIVCGTKRKYNHINHNHYISCYLILNFHQCWWGLYIVTYQECCVRSRYQGQGQVITSHSICGMWLLVPALDSCFWNNTHDIEVHFAALHPMKYVQHYVAIWITFIYMMTSSNGNIFRVTAICAGNSTVPGEFPTQRPVTRGFDVYFDLRSNKRLSKQWWGWWFETASRPSWRHRNDSSRLLHWHWCNHV